MKKRFYERTKIRYRPKIHSQLDSHKWASKMEIRCLLSGKPDLKLKPVEKEAV
jgi:hypothetical protein